MKSMYGHTVGKALVALLLLGSMIQFGAAAGEGAMTAGAYQKSLGRGLNVDWFERPSFPRNAEAALEPLRVRGFGHLRLAVDASRYKGNRFEAVEALVGQCAAEQLMPILSWTHPEAEMRADRADMTAYVKWWSDAADRLKGQRAVAFNLFEQLDEGCALLADGRFNFWMKQAVAAIRSVDPQRIIILSAPGGARPDPYKIDPAIFWSDEYMMVGCHLYAGGPDQAGGKQNWQGRGSGQDRLNVIEPIEELIQFVEDSGVECYIGSWMPLDRDGTALGQAEVERFAAFFLDVLSAARLPWAVNELALYYDDRSQGWVGQRKFASGQMLDMRPVVRVLVEQGQFGERRPAVFESESAAPEFGSEHIRISAAQELRDYYDSIASFAVDPDEDALTFSVVSGPAWLSISPTGELSGVPEKSDVGVNSWTVRVDSFGGSDEAKLSIVVMPDEPPVADRIKVDAGPDLRVEAEDGVGTAQVTLRAKGRGPIVLYRWMRDGAEISSARKTSLSLPVGEHRFVVEVTGVDGQVAHDEVFVKVSAVESGGLNGNLAPRFHMRVLVNTRTTVGRLFKKDISARVEDPDGDELMFSKVSGPGWLSVAPGGVIYGTPGEEDLGRSVATVRVEDGRGGSAIARIKVRVR